jgi:hypothetical protein
MAVEIPDIAVNRTDLYYVMNWTMPVAGTPLGVRDGYLKRVPIRGGKALQLAFISGGGSRGSQGLAITPAAAILSQAPGNDGGAGAIVSVPLDGGNATVLAPTKGVAKALVVDDVNVYFADTEATKSVPLIGGPPRTIAAAGSDSIGIEGETLYLADFSGHTVSTIAVDGGQVAVLAKNQQGPLDPVTCGTNLCWMNAGQLLNSSLMQLAPGATPVVLAEGFSEPIDLIYDGNNFFVTAGGGALSLLRIPSGGGTPLVAESETGISSMALDETCLYWSSLNGISSLARSAADVAGGTDQ